MAQRLIPPIDDCQLNAGYKSARYKKVWGFGHYGVDLIEVSKQFRVLRGMGNGKIIACGMDGVTSTQRLGNCIVVVYPDVILPDGRTTSLACRMFHLNRIDVKAGQDITPATILGEYGNTGAHSSGPHLHIEFDTDTKYPQYAFGIASSGKVIKKGTVDSTVDPCKVFWLSSGQSFTSPEAWIAEGWMTKENLNLPKLPANESDSSNGQQKIIEALQQENSELSEKIKIYEKKLDEIIDIASF